MFTSSVLAVVLLSVVVEKAQRLVFAFFVHLVIRTLFIVRFKNQRLP